MIDIAPRIVRVDAAVGAVLVSTAPAGGSGAAAGESQWAFWDQEDRSGVGLLVGSALLRPSHGHLELRRVPGSGVGVFATRPIAAGEEVLREPPILVASWSALPPGAARACAGAAAAAAGRMGASVTALARGAHTLSFNQAIGATDAARAAQQALVELQALVTEATFVPAVAWAKATAAVRAEVLALHCPRLATGGSASDGDVNTVPRPLVDAVAFGVAELRRGGWLEVKGIDGDDDGGGGGGSSGSKEAAASPQAKAQSEAQLQADLSRVCFIALSNFFDCCEGGSQHPGTAAGAFRVASRINHSCLPNCWWNCEAGCLVVRALVDVAPGEEVSHSYFEAERWQPRARRRQALASKFFVCGCARCESENGSEDLDARDAVMRAAEARNDPRAHHRARETAEAAPPRGPARLDPRDPWGVVAHCKAHWSGLGPAEVACLEECYRITAARASREATSAAGLQLARMGGGGSVCGGWGGGRGPVSEGDLLACLRPSLCALLADLHDLLADLHRMSCLWRGCADHTRARLALLRRLYPRPTNLAAWLAEGLADAASGAAGLPLELFVEPALLPVTRAMLARAQRPLPREVPVVALTPAASSAAAAGRGAARRPSARGQGLSGEARREVLGLFGEARTELALVYGCAPPPGTLPGALPSHEAVRVLDEKVRAIERYFDSPQHFFS